MELAGAISFSRIVVGRFRFGATMELGRSGRSMMTSASPGRGGGDGSGAGASAASYRVIDNRSENLQQLRSLSIPLV